MNASLREELGATAVPDFDMELPPGWSRSSVDDSAREYMVSALKRRLMETHQPQLYAESKRMLEESFAGMRKGGAFAFFAPTEADPGTLFIPASIIAAIRKADVGGSLDDMVRTLVRSHGATPLMGDKRTLRFEKEKTVRLGTETVINQSVIYLTPIPGTKRRRALQLVAGFGRTIDTPADAPAVKATKLLFDSCVASLRWRIPPGQ